MSGLEMKVEQRKIRMANGGKYGQPRASTVGASESAHAAGLSPRLRRLQIDLDEQHQVIQDRRNQRRDGDLAVRHLQELGHDERGRAHHRRHQLAAGGRDGLDRRGDAGRKPIASSSEW